MNLYELLNQVEEDHKNLINEALTEVSVESCFSHYECEHKGNQYQLKFNLLTLDFIAITKIPVSLRSKIKSYFILSDVLKWKFKKEGRAFFDFLKLYYTDYNEVVFTDCESPDFIIHDQGRNGYEITEATDAHNAKFNETIYLLTGMEKSTPDFSIYLKQIEKSFYNKDKRKPYSSQTIVSNSTIYGRIITCIIKKASKYREYDVTLDTRNIVVFNNRIGFRRDSDFETISQRIKNHEEIKNSNIDKIYIISGTHDVMAEYNTSGEVLSIIRK